MKKLIEQYKSKKKELADREEKQRHLLSEQVTFHAKLTATKKLLHETEIEQVQLLRRAWSLRKVDDAVSTLHNLETGRRANDCAPGSISDDLAQFRAGIDSGLSEIYGETQVKEMRSNLSDISMAVEAIKKHLAALKDSIESLDVEIQTAKAELAEAHRAAWSAIYQEMAEDLRKTVMPRLKRAYAAACGYSPYSTTWPDFLNMLFPQDRQSKNFYSSSDAARAKKELFEMIAELRKEFFGKE